MTLVEGVLYRKWFTVVCSIRWLQLVPPKSLRREIIKLVHEKAASTWSPKDDRKIPQADLLEEMER